MVAPGFDYGGVTVVGRFVGGVTLGPGEPSEQTFLSGSQDDTFIARYNPDGTLLWASQMTSPSFVAPAAVVANGSGGLVLLAEMSGEVRLEPTLTGDPLVVAHRSETTLHDLLIVQLDDQGQFLWANTIGENHSKAAGGLAVGNDGAIYVNGDFMGPIGTTVGLGADSIFLANETPDRHVFVARFEADGSVGWARVLAGTALDRGIGLTLDELGNPVAMGTYYETLVVSEGEPDEVVIPAVPNFWAVLAYLVSYDPDGGVRWVRTPGSDDANEYPRAVGLAGDSLLLVGNASSRAVFGEGEPNEFSVGVALSAYVAGYQSDGTLAYGRYEASPGDAVNPMAVAGSALGATAVGGNALGDYTFVTPGETPDITPDIPARTYGPYTATYTPDGELQCVWIQNSNGDFTNQVSALAYDDNNGLYMAGYFTGNLDIDDGQGGRVPFVAGGSGDVFVAHYTLVDPSLE